MVEDGASGTDGRYGCPAKRIEHSHYLEFKIIFDKSIRMHYAMAVTTCSRTHLGPSWSSSWPSRVTLVFSAKHPIFDGHRDTVDYLGDRMMGQHDSEPKSESDQIRRKYDR